MTIKQLRVELGFKRPIYLTRELEKRGVVEHKKRSGYHLTKAALDKQLGQRWMKDLPYGGRTGHNMYYLILLTLPKQLLMLLSTSASLALAQLVLILLYFLLLFSLSLISIYQVKDLVFICRQQVCFARLAPVRDAKTRKAYSA